MLPIPIYKGDSTDAFGVRVIKINLKTELVLTNATATFTLLSFKKNFTSAELATKVLTITIPAEVTKGFPIGNVYGKLCLYDSSLRVLTAACHIPFRVELAGSGIYGGLCAERTPLAEVTVEAGVDYSLAYNKPTINNVVVDGDKTAADYGLALISQIPTMLSQLHGDATHRTVTDVEKARWNAGSSIPDLDTIRANAQMGANHSRLKNNPHQVSKSQVGLGNVDNTSDANKPVSTAQQTALNNKVDKVPGKGLSEKDFTASDKSKLDGIESGAQKNVNANWTSASGAAGFIQNKPKCEIADLPEEFTEDEMRTKLNALLGWMRTNFAVVTVGILMAASTFAEPVVQKARKGAIPNTTEIVTNVTGLSDLASKTYVDDKVASATPGDYYNVSNKAYTALQQTDILNVTESTATDKALSANMGKELQDQITNLKQRGRYLSVWNARTGLAETTPTVTPYIYKAGDYFIVGVVSTNIPSVNYKPTGSTYSTNAPSRVVESQTLLINDTYYYDGSSWSLLQAAQKEVSFSGLAGSPYDNAELATALNASITNVFTNGVSAVVGKVANITIPSPMTTNAVSGIITNHVESGYLCTVASAQAKANAAEAAAKAEAENKYVKIGNQIEIGSYYSDNTLIHANWVRVGNGNYKKWANLTDNGFSIETESDVGLTEYTMMMFPTNVIKGSTYTFALTSDIPDNSAISTIATNAVADSTTLWTASNAKLTTRINQVAAPVATNAAEAVVANKAIGTNKVNVVGSNFAIDDEDGWNLIYYGEDEFWHFNGYSLLSVALNVGSQREISSDGYAWKITDGFHPNGGYIASRGDITKLATSPSVSTNIAEKVFAENADYALTNLTAASLSLRSGEIGNYATAGAAFTLTLDFPNNGRSGDCLLYVANTGAADAAITLSPNTYTYVGTDVAKARTLGKATTNIVSFTRVNATTVLVSKQEVK